MIWNERGHRPARRLRRWCKALVLSGAVMMGLIGIGASPALAQERGYFAPRSSGYVDVHRPPTYSYGFSAYGYTADPYHLFTGPGNHHVGPHSAPHAGQHYHLLHGYHNGLHWQRHYDDHGTGGHLGIRPWRPH